MTLPLFEPRDEAPTPAVEPLAPGACVLRGFVLAHEDGLLGCIEQVTAQAPFRHLRTPGGRRMAVAMSNCGAWGWVSDERGYRYSAVDPLNDAPWPAMPPLFAEVTHRAAGAAGFDGFVPDACLLNRYEVGTGLSLHQDRNERDMAWPIVSVSLGLPAVFLFGGDQRGGRVARVLLSHGDIAVWGGLSRLRFHGVAPLKPGEDRRLGSQRINLTFRRAR